MDRPTTVCKSGPMYQSVGIWWRRRPRSQRRLVLAGAVVSLALLGAGIVTDMVGGKEFYDDHPFISSIPKDMFKVVLFGTIGVLLLEDWRSRLRNWPKLRADLKTVEDAAARMTDQIARHLGFSDATTAPSVFSYTPILEGISQRLYGAHSIFEKAATDADGQDDTSGPGLSDAWKRAVVSFGLPADDDFSALERAVDELRKELRQIATLSSAGTMQTAIDTVVKLQDLVRDLAILLPLLRDLPTASAPPPQELRRMSLGFLQLSTNLHLLSLSLKRLEFEASNGSAYPGRN